MRTGVALLLIGAGAALVWLLKGKGGPKRFDRKLTLRAGGGACGVEEPDLHPVVLSRGRGDEVHWLIRNPQGTGCAGVPHVCMGEWTRDGLPADPPVERVNGGDLCDDVPQPQTVPIHARAKPHAPKGQYKYSVLVNGSVAIDPMIQIVL